MPRIQDLENLLCPVETRPVFASVKTDGGERSIAIPGKMAVVDARGGRVLGVVSRNYRLVTNKTALEWAFKCCHEVFPETCPVEWSADGVDAPSTRGHCFIDLVHRTGALDFDAVRTTERPDVFGPFIRVTNSYNGMRALRFDIGYHRKVCSNGLIIPESLISFRFSHLKQDIGEEINFAVNHAGLKKAKSQFLEAMGVLCNCDVARPHFRQMVDGVLGLRKPGGLQPKSPQADGWESVESHLDDLCDKYAGELGENAYAILNVSTEFASQPRASRFVYRDRHGMQRSAGIWFESFRKKCQEPGFSIADYLKNLDAAHGNGRESSRAARSNDVSLSR